MKKILSLAVAIIILGSLIISGCSQPASTTTAPQTSAPASTSVQTSAPQASTTGAQKPIELSFASTSPDSAEIGKHLQRWADKIKSDSGGRLTVRIYPNNTLVSGPDMRKGVKEGAADIGTSAIYVVDPEFQVEVNLPQLILAKDTLTADKIYTALHNKYTDIFNSEWKSYKFLWMSPTLPTFLYTVNKPIQTLADMKGMQIRAPSKLVSDLVTSLGGTPVSMSMPDWLVSLDKHTTDGAATTTGTLPDFQVGPKLKYCTTYSFGTSMWFTTMNLNTYNKLSPDLQKVIDNSVAWGRDDEIKTWVTYNQGAIDYAKTSGVQMTDLSSDERAKWDAATKSVYDKMATDLDSKGYPGTDFVKMALDLAKANAQ
jgi:TRAP-type C4-dicarboxylate transport system substrate-binding protein